MGLTIGSDTFTLDLSRDDGALDIEQLPPEATAALADAGVSPEQLAAIAGKDHVVKGGDELRALYRELNQAQGHRPTQRLELTETDPTTGQEQPTRAGRAVQQMRQSVMLRSLIRHDPSTPTDVREIGVDPARGMVYRAGTIPPNERADAIAKAKAAWGTRPLAFERFVDEGKELTVARAFHDAARPDLGISPAFLYTVALGEGTNLYLADHTRHSDVNIKAPIDGYQYLGTDTFGTRAAALKQQGLIDPSWKAGKQYTVQTETNEKQQTVKSATFKDLPTGLTALTAMLAAERRNFERDAAEVLGEPAAAQLTADQKDFFSYVYFNAGPGFGKRALERWGLDYGRPWSGPDPADNRNPRFNAAQRMATKSALEAMGLF
jgi:hypothetical protein